jgi:hypothetical protein
LRSPRKQLLLQVLRSPLALPSLPVPLWQQAL